MTDHALIAEAARARLVDALAQTAARNREGLRKVYDLTSAKLFGICLRISVDREAAEDILQDVYIKIWNRAELFDATRASPVTWLCAIARNTALDWRRANPIKVVEADPEVLEAVADERPGADFFIEQDQTSAHIFHCLDQLEEKQKAAIRSAFFEGLTYAEVAERLAVPLGTVKSWIRRGMQQLKGCLGDG